MKINESHFGKKIAWVTWNENDGVKWFVPHAFCFKNPNRMYGFDSEGKVNTFLNDELWDPFEEPPKKVIPHKEGRVTKRMAPALMKDRHEENYFISRDIFSSKEDFEEYYNNRSHTFDLIKWPASEAMFVEIEVEE